MTTWLQCAECNEMFEVSNAIAEAMHHWREESGDPFLCVDCATHIAWGTQFQRWTSEKWASVFKSKTEGNGFVHRRRNEQNPHFSARNGR